MSNPNPKDWIIPYGDRYPDAYFVWDEWERKYIVYVLGVGLFKETKGGDWVKSLGKDENSEYYRTLVDRINEVQMDHTKLNNTPPKPKVKVEPWKYKNPIEKEKKIIPKKEHKGKYYTITCKGCEHKFRIKKTKGPKKVFHNNACKQRYYRKKSMENEIKRKQNMY